LILAAALLLAAVGHAPASAQSRGCSYFQSRLADLPGLDLVLNTGAFNSIWDGKRTDGCEVVFESHTSVLSEEDARRKFDELITSPGWKVNEMLSADGPGSATVALEKRGERCALHWSRHAWIEAATHQDRRSEDIRILVQCSEIPD
jgi:hypothetical protein